MAEKLIFLFTALCYCNDRIKFCWLQLLRLLKLAELGEVMASNFTHGLYFLLHNISTNNYQKNGCSLFVDRTCDSFVREETHRGLRDTTTFVFQDGGLTTSTWFGVHVTKSLPVYTTALSVNKVLCQTWKRCECLIVLFNGRETSILLGHMVKRRWI